MLYLAGGVVALLAVGSSLTPWAPSWSQLHTRGILVTAVLALLMAGGLIGRAAHVGAVTCHLATAVGTLLIGMCQLLAAGGEPTAITAMAYIWVVLHPALYFTRRVVLCHLAFAALVQTAALVALGDSSSLAPQLVLTAGTQLPPVLIITSLAARLRSLADTDPLTGLGNRRVAARALAAALASSSAGDARGPSVAVLDLDDFKVFNDTYGHLAGDDLLSALADRWSVALRETDTLARTGGDEFVLVLPDCAHADADALVRLLAEDVPAGVGCSAGVATWDGVESHATLLRRADAAMYGAKADGLHVVVADAELQPDPS